MAAPTDVKVTWDELSNKAQTVEANQSYRFVVPARWLRIALRDDSGVPAAAVKYVVEAGGKKLEGKTDNQGLVEQRLPAAARAGVLRVWLHGEKKPATDFELDLGGLPPIDTVAGVQARLAALGFGTLEANGQLDDATQAALAKFQAFVGLDKATGKLDEPTRQKLAQLHDGA